MTAKPTDVLSGVVGGNVKRWREHRGLSQQQLERAAEIKRSTLVLIELGNRQVRVDELLRLARALNCAAVDLLLPMKRDGTDLTRVDLGTGDDQHPDAIVDLIMGSAFAADRPDNAALLTRMQTKVAERVQRYASRPMDYWQVLAVTLQDFTFLGGLAESLEETARQARDARASIERFLAEDAGFHPTSEEDTAAFDAMRQAEIDAGAWPWPDPQSADETEGRDDGEEAL